MPRHGHSAPAAPEVDENLDKSIEVEEDEADEATARSGWSLPLASCASSDSSRRRVAAHVAVFAVAGGGLWFAMYEVYFTTLSCGSIDGLVREGMEQILHTLGGALPALARTVVGAVVVHPVCRRLTGFHERGPSLGVALLVGGHAEGDGQAKGAGWEAIVGGRISKREAIRVETASCERA